ncbi:MAG: hypothetical protein RBS27_01465 [Giesbergeria sp.]|nr:hypothetical protein [Giesbergeria sp.]
MILRIVPTVRHAMALALIAAIDAGTGPAYFEFYTGGMTEDVGDAVTAQVKLGTLVCGDPSATDTDGTITFAPVTQDSGADASGTAAWVVLKDGDGNVVLDGDVTSMAGTGFARINTTTIVEGGPIAATGVVITIGG